jgi:septal ring factor EnvC (AmiA/AmiB activator)
MEKDL